jgi:hypothetical protein
MSAQLIEPKFGNVELSDLEMTRYDTDTSAAALMLFNSGNSYFILNSDVEFQFVYERHCQIKIFKKSAFDMANFSIRLYESGTSKEVLSNLKAYTYNLVNGKVVKTKLDNDNIYRSRTDKTVNVTFALPEVREGSVIEVAYNITSDFLYDFRGWTFQYSIPARWSQYSYRIPEYFKYRESTKGYYSFNVNKRKKGTSSFVIQGDAKSSQASQRLTPLCDEVTLGLVNVPAFVSEPNIDCEENYIQSIEFELSAIQYPGQTIKEYTQTWESVNKKMKEDSDFGLLLKSNNFVRDTVAALCLNKKTDLEKATSIYNYVQSRMKWNQAYSLWSMKGLKKPFEEKSGNSAEINMLLTLMLQTAGLLADPVLFSTRGNGIAISYYPTISKYNSVLSKVDIGGKRYLLDATTKYCPFGVLPPNDINGTGRIINNSNGEWVDLNASDRYAEEKNYVLNISEDGRMTGYIKGLYAGYAGLVYRNTLNSEKTEDDYIRKLQENLKGLSILKYQISDKAQNYLPLKDSLVVDITDNSEVIGDKILINPLLFEKIEKNRYTLEERKYPVNYNFPYAEKYSFTYYIPAGYKVESLPSSTMLKLEDNSISVTYKVENIDNKVIVNYQRNIGKTIFLPSEYKNLKQLYDLLIKKHSEQIILTKKV